MLQRRYALFFLFMSIPIIGHVTILPLLWDLAGRDAWISILLATPFGMGLAFFLWRMMTLSPGKTFVEITQDLWGRGGRYLFSLPFFIYGAYLFLMTQMSITDMMSAGFFQETPFWFLGLAFLLLVLYVLIKGVEVLAFMAGLLTLIVMITGHSITLLLTPQRDWRAILPFLEYGWMPVLYGMFLIIAMWSELFFLAFIRFHRVETKGFFLFILAGVLANSIMALSVGAGTITIFGMEQADNMLYPALSSVRMVTLGFVDRFDVYGLILMTFGSFIRGGLQLYALVQLLPRRLLRSKRMKTAATLSLGFLLYFLSLILYGNKIAFEELIRYYIYGLLLQGIPILYLLKGRLARRKKGIAQQA